MSATPTLSVSQAFTEALHHHQAGRLSGAEALYRQILATEPHHAGAWHYLGVLAHQSGRQDLALEWIRRAIQLEPNDPAAHSNLGEACRISGLLEEAASAYRRALELKPDFAEASHNLGLVLVRQERPEEAIAATRRALALHPGYGEAWSNLGSILLEQGRFEEAAAACHRALELLPGDPQAHSNLGLALARQGRFEEAIPCYRRALELQRYYPEAHCNLGLALAQCGQFAEAVATYRRAIELRPGYPQARNNLGVALAALGLLDEAVAAYRLALQLYPNDAEIHNNLGLALARRGQLDEAVTAYRRAIQLQPGLAEAHDNLGTALKSQGRLEESIAASRRALELQPDNATVHSNLIYALHFHPAGEAAIAAEQHRWNRRFGDPLRRSIREHPHSHDPERRLRIGYVSPDFRDHVVGRNVLPLLAHHDREKFDVLCYSTVVQSDAMTDRFRVLAAEWRDVANLSDQRLADLIRADAVDVLVDLSLHTGGNRLLVFARQPAPVQTSFAGYPASSGVEAIPYRISDRWLESEIALGRPEAVVTDPKFGVFLVDSFWCYDPCGIEVDVGRLPALENGGVTFGSLNNFGKVNRAVLQLWARVLREVPDARLVLLSGAGGHREQTLQVFEQANVARERVEFVEPCPRRAYLEWYHRLDIALDPFPYNGHTTNLDALWMGVPVISLAGEQSVSRAGYSQLSNLGLPELVAFSENDYVRIAAQLAHDRPRLLDLRRTLRARMEDSPLMDAPGFARHIEAAYRAMWRYWCAEGGTLAGS